MPDLKCEGVLNVETIIHAFRHRKEHRLLQKETDVPESLLAAPGTATETGCRLVQALFLFSNRKQSFS